MLNFRGAIFVVLCLFSVKIIAGGHGGPEEKTGGGAFVPPKLDVKEFPRQLNRLDEIHKEKDVLKVGYGVFTRGNDDARERDGKGISNFRTAQHLVAVQTIQEKGGIRVKLIYDTQLTTDEAQAAVIGANFMLGETKNNIPGAPGQSKMLDYTLARRDGKTGPIISGTTLTSTIDLGLITKDGSYSGVAKVAFGGGGRAGNWPKDGAGAQQTIDWGVAVKDGKVTVTDVGMAQTGTPDRRPTELLSLVASSDAGAVFGTPHDWKNGVATGPAKIGN